MLTTLSKLLNQFLHTTKPLHANHLTEPLYANCLTEPLYANHFQPLYANRFLTTLC
mgnify:FL=1